MRRCFGVRVRGPRRGWIVRLFGLRSIICMHTLSQVLAYPIIHIYVSARKLSFKYIALYYAKYCDPRVKGLGMAASAEGKKKCR